MRYKIISTFVASLIFVVSATVASAAPQSRNTLSTISLLKSTSQVSQMELVYQELLKKKRVQSRITTRPESNHEFKIFRASFSPIQDRILIHKGKKHRKKGRSKSYKRSLRVTATAYTSHVNQTDSTPNIAAWGDRLRPGMKVIAVSRDLLKKYGLKHRQRVRIKGLKGEYRVLDKMNKRWRKKIDIYMGKDKRKAFRWGRRKVHIYWN